MAAFFELLQMSVISVLTVPANPFFWLVIYLVYIQYRKLYEIEVQLLGQAPARLVQAIKSAVIFGGLGGLVGTMIIMVLGITIDTGDFSYIFLLAIILMLINIRYICFSYAGGILALSSLILGVPKINVSSILAIVAILHLVESILIWIDGHKNAMPIFIMDKYGEVVGGLSCNRFWPVAFTILLAAAGPLAGSKDIDLPQWWPLFNNGLDIENIALQIFPVVAILGYGDMALTSTSKERCHRASIRLFLYSIILLILSVLSTELMVFKYLAALFSPIGHEILILYGQREEKAGTPIFTQPSRGVRILDIKKDSVGWQMNLRQGDILLYINGRPVNSKEDIDGILKDFPPYIWVEVKGLDGYTRTLEYKNYLKGINKLGLILVSKDSDIIFDPRNSMSFIQSLVVELSKKYLKHKNNHKKRQ